MGKTFKDYFPKPPRMPKMPPNQRFKSDKDYDRKRFNIDDELQNEEE